MQLSTLFLLGLIVTCTIVHPVQAQSCSITQACGTSACCSEWGNCGYGPEFCGTGCLRDCNAKPECGLYAKDDSCPLKVCCGQWGFCGTTSDFCEAGCQNNCQSSAPKVCDAGRAKSLYYVGYYASWSSERKCNPFLVRDIDPRNYTHLNYAFGTIVNGEMVVPIKESGEGSKLTEFSSLKLINRNLKVLISVGGWAFNDPGPSQNEFHNIALNVESREKFISTVIRFLEAYSFDGIDIDWEYPVAVDRGGYPEDKDNYILLLKQMRERFGSKWLITIAAPASYWYLRHFEVEKMSKHLDWINMMTYDFHGVWDADSSLGSLVRPHSSILEMKEALTLFLKDGVDPDKLVLGLAYYGRSFTLQDASCNKIGCQFSGPASAGECTNSPGTLAWFEISKIIVDSSLSPVYDSASETQILTFGNNQWVSYDDEFTFWKKSEWAATSCLKGVMIWSIDQGHDKINIGRELQQVGTVTIAKMHTYFDTLVLGEPPALVIESDRDSLDGFDAYVITSEIDQTEISRNHRHGCNQYVPLDNLFAAYQLVQLSYSTYGNNDTRLYATSTLLIDELDNPITAVHRRYIDSTRSGQRVYRTEALRATIHPWHLRESRSDFSSNDYVYESLGGVRGQDDRGHILGSFAGGPGGTNYYNMAPQYWRLNQNSVNAQDWVAMEHAIRQHFRDTGNQGYVEYGVVLIYSRGSFTGRPLSWAWALVLVDQNGNLREISGILRNEDQSGTDRPRPIG